TSRAGRPARAAPLLVAAERGHDPDSQEKGGALQLKLLPRRACRSGLLVGSFRLFGLLRFALRNALTQFRPEPRISLLGVRDRRFGCSVRQLQIGWRTAYLELRPLNFRPDTAQMSSKVLSPHLVATMVQAEQKRDLFSRHIHHIGFLDNLDRRG